MQEGERSAESAARVLKGKAGIKDVFLEQLYTFDSLERDQRGRTVSITFFALTPLDKLAFSGTDTQTPTLFPAESLPTLAFDHNEIVKYAMQRLRSKLEYTNAVMSLLPQQFTLSELQGTYEAILDRPLDKRNFQKKFMSLDLIEPTDDMRTGAKHRPARLYRFAHNEPAELKKFF